jgi:epoxyqueuosine reductase QueG
MIIIMERDLHLTKEIEEYCKEIGVHVVGFADPSLFDRFPEANRPQTFLHDVKTVILIGFHLYDLTLDAWNYIKGENRSYQFVDSIIENLCHRVKRKLGKMGYKSLVISYIPGLYLKDSAALAGIGPIGKNNLLITPTYGSQVRLRSIVTTAPIKCGEPVSESEYCNNCNICHDACPANAFINGKYTKSVCDEWARANWQKLSDHTVIWCNTCIESCPITKKKIG